MSVSAASCIYCPCGCGCTDVFADASLCLQKCVLPGLKELQEGIEEWEESQQKKTGITLDNQRARAFHFSNIKTKNNDKPLLLLPLFPVSPKSFQTFVVLFPCPVLLPCTFAGLASGSARLPQLLWEAHCWPSPNTGCDSSPCSCQSFKRQDQAKQRVFQSHSCVSGSSKTLWVLQASRLYTGTSFNFSLIHALIQMEILPLFFSCSQKEHVREFICANLYYHAIAHGLKWCKGTLSPLEKGMKKVHQ